MSVTEIEAAITELSTNDFAELREWFLAYQEKLWDKQIEHDLEAGRLDAVLAEVDAEYDAGLSQPL
jgi:hypothetical protein